MFIFVTLNITLPRFYKKKNLLRGCEILLLAEKPVVLK